MDTITLRGDTGRVRQVDLPADARALTALPQIDYEDAFIVETGPAQRLTAEQWSRAILEDAPASVRHKLRSGWAMLGLKLGQQHQGRTVLGWPVRDSTPEWVVLAGESRLGMRGELLFKRGSDSVLFATFVKYDSVAARATWAAVKNVHVKVVRDLLEQASRRANP